MRGVQSGKKYADTIRFCTQSLQFLLESMHLTVLKIIFRHTILSIEKVQELLKQIDRNEIDALS